MIVPKLDFSLITIKLFRIAIRFDCLPLKESNYIC